MAKVQLFIINLCHWLLDKMSVFKQVKLSTEQCQVSISNPTEIDTKTNASVDLWSSYIKNDNRTWSIVVIWYKRNVSEESFDSMHDIESKLGRHRSQQCPKKATNFQYSAVSKAKNPKKQADGQKKKNHWWEYPIICMYGI